MLLEEEKTVFRRESGRLKPGRTMKVLLCGHYGRRNSGDDMFLNAVIRGLKNEFGPIEFTVPCKSSVPVFEKEAVRFSPSSEAWMLYRIFANDWLVFGGGVLVQEGHEPSVLERQWRWVRFAKLLGKKVVFLGIGVGPFFTEAGRTLAKKMLEQADFVSVRDEKSARWLSENQVDVFSIRTFDMSVLLKDVMEAPERPSGDPVLGVSLLAMSVHKNDQKDIDHRLLASLSKALNDLMAEDPRLRVKVFVLHEGDKYHFGDSNISFEFYQKLDEKERADFLDYLPDPRELFRHIASCTALVGMRLHANILAYLARRPFLMLDYHIKCEAFADAIGLPAEAVVRRSELFECDAEVFKQKLRGLLRTPRQLAPHVAVDDCYRDLVGHFSKVKEHMLR